MDDRLYTRAKAVCCQAWGVPPWEFDEAARAERLTAEDVLECLLLCCHEPMGANPLDFINREKKAERREKFQQVKRLVALARMEKDPGRRAELERQITEANR